MNGPAEPGSDHRAPQVVDARGLRCPLPVIRLAEAAKDAAVGAEITVLATDPAVRHDVPAWARMRGHEVIGSAEDAAAGTGAATLAITVRVGRA